MGSNRVKDKAYDAIRSITTNRDVAAKGDTYHESLGEAERPDYLVPSPRGTFTERHPMLPPLRHLLGRKVHALLV
jgi:hypothetical protein